MAEKRKTFVVLFRQGFASLALFESPVPRVLQDPPLHYGIASYLFYSYSSSMNNIRYGVVFGIGAAVALALIGGAMWYGRSMSKTISIRKSESTSFIKTPKSNDGH